MSCESIFCCYKRPEYSINESNVDSIDLEVRPHQSTASSSSPSSPQKNTFFHILRYRYMPDSANIVRSLAYASWVRDVISHLDIYLETRGPITSEAEWNRIKKKVDLYGHDIIFRELLNLWSEVTDRMGILLVCRILEISPLEIDNQLEYIKLILMGSAQISRDTVVSRAKYTRFWKTIYVRSVDGALAHLNMIKKEVLLYGHDIIFRELLNSRPKVTGTMILDVCRLLEISPLEIDNQLEYIKLILMGSARRISRDTVVSGAKYTRFWKTIYVRSVDGALAHLNMIKKEVLLYGHDIIFRELLNSRPKITGKMILEVCRLLEISPQEIDNQLEYIKLILGQRFRETMDVRSVDGSLAHLNMIKKEVLLYGHDIIFRELLNPRPEVTVVTRSKMILEVCRLLEISPLEIDNQLEYIKLILGQEFRETVDVRSVDDIGNTALHYALERNWYEAATLLLKEGSYLGQVNIFNNIVIADIPEFILSSYFNDCIQLKKEWTDECTIEFDYRCSMPHENFTEQQEISRATCEMEVILYIANNDTLKHLLKHPLISSFLYIKWYMIRHVLYANFVFYTMFYFFVNAYILSMTYDTSRNRQQIANDSFNTVFACTLQNNLSWVFAMGMWLFFTSREILQFISYPQRYLVDLENWSQVLLIVLTLALLCGAGLQIGGMVILLSTWELMTLISHHLFPSTCIEMFRTVFFNFVRFSFPHLILILAFTLAFYMLLRNDGFSNPGLSLFKTIIMFTREFDAKDISFSAYPVWSRIVFMLFIFYIVIVLFNLLKGLAVSNIAEILNKAEIIGLTSRVRLIACFERMIVAKPFCWNSKWTWSNPFNFFSNKILLFPHYLRCGKISFKPYDDNLIVYDGDRHNVDGYSMDWSTLKMDPNIVKHAKQVIYDKNELSNNDITNELAKLQTRLTQIKNTLRCEDDAEENIFLN
ncbi:transient receptor potential cation channel protein painless-like isoform X2 [Temnothorax nylanderi]|uniref:transient receptor potential cation channel protein painless-like isoform X2 n=1 Tax=Temnothorax nylanderi TaxID=102681 RepID=UPI003A862120